MKEDLLIEQLKRIQEMMGIEPKNTLVENSNQLVVKPENILLERVPMGPIGMSPEASTALVKGFKDMTKEKSTFKIGPGTDYKFPMEGYGNLEVVEGTKVYTIGSDMTTKKMFGDNWKVLTGTVVDADGTSHDNQQYIMVSTPEGDKKACLPDNSIWTKAGGPFYGKVYKFTVPVRSGGSFFSTVKNGRVTFSMYMDMSKSVGDESATEVENWGTAIACRGGSNGWSILNSPPLYFTEGTNGTLIGYNSASIAEGGYLDTRSDWEVWYDHYGHWLEIGIGVAAALTGMGIAAWLTRIASAAAAAQRATWATTLIKTLAETKIAGGPLLSILCQVITEGVMMSPLITWQFNNDREDDAYLCVVFCFLPFLTETKVVSKYISGRYGKEAAKGLVEKFQKAGVTALYEAANAGNKEAAEKLTKFIGDLTITELKLFQDSVKLVSKKEGVETFEKGLKEFLTDPNNKFVQEILQTIDNKVYEKTWMGSAGKIFGEETSSTLGKIQLTLFNKGLNPLTSKYMIPGAITRMGVPLVLFTAAYKLTWNMLESDDDKEKLEEMYDEVFANEEMVKFQKKMLEYDKGFFDKVAAKSLEKLTDNREALKEFVNGNSQYYENLFTEGTIEELNNDMVKQKMLTPKQNQAYLELTKLISDSSKKTMMVREGIIAFYENIGYTDVKVLSQETNDDVSGTLKHNKEEFTFRYKVDNDKTSWYVNGKLISDTEILDISERVKEENNEETTIALKDVGLDTSDNNKKVIYPEIDPSHLANKTLKIDNEKTIESTKKYCIRSRKGGWIETDEKTYSLTTNSNDKCEREYSECSSCDKQEKDLYKYCVKKDINDVNTWTNTTKEEYEKQQYLAAKCIKSGIDLNTNCNTCEEQPDINVCKTKWKAKQINRLQFIECKKRSNLKNWFN